MSTSPQINNSVTFSDGTHFDLNLLDQLKGRAVEGNIWAQYNSTQKGGNNNGIFDQSEIDAIKRDLMNSAQNGKIDNQTLGNLLGNNNPNTIKTAQNEFNALMLENSIKETNLRPYIHENDATRVYTPDLKFAERFNVEDLKLAENINLLKKSDGKTAYLEIYKDYEPKDKKKYQIVENYVRTNYAKQHSGKIDKNAIKGITNMVSALSEKYGVDPEIIAGILNVESGGYVFSDKVMKNPGRQYKGVMQVDLETLECMYADPNDWKTKGSKLTKHQYAVSYDHRHYAADDARIAELKKEYPTPEALYEAIQSDVSLGVEVGIMAFKGKLSRTKGYTSQAVKQYCAGQYRVTSDTIPERIWPLQKYNDYTKTV